MKVGQQRQPCGSRWYYVAHWVLYIVSAEVWGYLVDMHSSICISQPSFVSEALSYFKECSIVFLFVIINTCKLKCHICDIYMMYVRHRSKDSILYGKLIYRRIHIKSVWSRVTRPMLVFSEITHKRKLFVDSVPILTTTSMQHNDFRENILQFCL